MSESKSENRDEFKRRLMLELESEKQPNLELENRIIEVAHQAIISYLESRKDSDEKKTAEYVAISNRIQEQINGANQILQLLEEIKASLGLQMGNINLERDVLEKLKAKL